MKDSQNDWMQVVRTKITDLAAGIYEVRYAAKEVTLLEQPLK